MNKAITEGLQFTPAPFSAGLQNWSSGAGTAGAPSYENVVNAAFVPADPDFGGCLELLKTSSQQLLRSFATTPILPGCYLRVSARVKAMAGAMPSLRVSILPLDAQGAPLPDAPNTGPVMALQSYGQEVTVSAILGTGARTGVDMALGLGAAAAHIGLQLEGPNGGVVRIDDIEVEDITAVFLRDMLGWVDVRDYGAVGDGTTDDSAAFEAADAVADGRLVKVPAGQYFLGQNVTFENPVAFEGTVTMPDSAFLSLTRNFDLPSYIAAFGDEVQAFRKAFQALLNNADHEGLDLGGRRINLRAPIDMQAAVANRTEYAQRRHIRNGQFYVENSSAWDSEIATSLATYSQSAPLELSNVANVANIAVGSLVEGAGVGREVYVREKNIAQARLVLSAPLYDAVGKQEFTFTRFKYILDFSGFEKLSKFSISDVEFLCRGQASGILMAPEGLIFQLRDCFITDPKDRGLTSPGRGCQGMLIDRCQFLSNETGQPAQTRTTIAMNANANDVKLRDNRITQFRHFAVLGGTSSLILGNHWFQGDDEPEGVRTAGLVLTSSHNRATITGNYIDNCSLEWTNEHDPDPDFANEFSFSGLSITNNIFQTIGVAPWFRFIVVKPYGQGHFIIGLTITGNIFRAIQGDIERIDHVDTSFASLNYARFRNILVQGNAFNSIERGTRNPAVVRHSQNSPASTWTVDCAGPLPFGGWAQNIEALVSVAPQTTASGATRHDMPHCTTAQGTARDQVTLQFPVPVSGEMALTVRIDN